MSSQNPLSQSYVILPYYRNVYQLASMIKENALQTLFISGQAGIGKTTLVDHVMEGDQRYIKIGGHITPYMLYVSLYENKDDRIIFFDDTDDILGSRSMLALLKQALDTKLPKKVMWLSSRKILENVSDKFEFNSRVIFSFNWIPRDEGFKAILSRADVAELSLKYGQIIDCMFKIAQSSERTITNITLTTGKRQELVEFIKRLSSPATLNFSLRTQDKIEVYYAMCPENWEALAKSLLDQVDEEMLLLLRVLDDETANSMEQKCSKWIRQTNKSRRTFYRLKRKLEES